MVFCGTAISRANSPAGTPSGSRADQQAERVQPRGLGERREGRDGLYFIHTSRIMDINDECKTGRRERKVKNYETRKNALNYEDLPLFLTPSALNAAVSEHHAVADGRDPPDRRHDGSHFGWPLDGGNAPKAERP